MSERTRAIIVEDDDDWAGILENALAPNFVVERAKSFSDVRRLLETDERRIEIALVDIHLGDSDSGLDIMFVLSKLGTPCIAVTAYDNQKAVRDALVRAGAKDIWFKVQENSLALREKIETAVLDARQKLLARQGMASPFFPPVDGEVEPDLVFVIMPFRESWSPEILIIVRSIAKELNLEVKTSDDIFASPRIMNDIWQSINRAGLIIADITVHNANVFYELGIAHTLGKEFNLIRQPNGEKPPFDILGLRYFEYELTPTGVELFKDQLSKVFDSYLKKYNIGKEL